MMDPNGRAGDTAPLRRRRVPALLDPERPVVVPFRPAVEPPPPPERPEAEGRK